MADNTYPSVDELKEQISFQRELTSLQSKMMKTAADRTSLEQEITDQYVEQYMAAQKYSGLEKQLLETHIKSSALVKSLLVLREAQARNIGNQLTISNEILAAEEEHRRVLFEQKNLENQILQIQKERNALVKWLNDSGFTKTASLLEKIQKLIANPMLAGITVLSFAVKSIVSLFLQLDKAAEDFRKSVGLTRYGTSEIELSARTISIHYARLGVTAKEVYESFAETGKQLGTIQALSDETATNISLLTSQLGIAAATSVDFSRTMALISESTINAQQHIMMFVKDMADAGGVPLAQVMTDVAGASKSAYSFLSRSPLQLAKAAVEARRMGTSLGSTVASAKALVDFTSSVKSEMAASVLLGHSVNLQKARELAYAKDNVGLQKELLHLAKENKFNQLDPFQQEAFAAALGKSSDEIAQMLQADKQRADIEQRTLSDDKLKIKVKRYKDMAEANEKMAKALANSAENTLRTESNQAALTSISLAWKQILQRVGEVFLPKIASVMETIAEWATKASDFTVGWNTALVAVYGTLALITALLIKQLLQNFVLRLAGAAAASGPGITGFFMSVAAGLQSLILAVASTGPIGIVVLLALTAAAIGLAFAVSLIMKALPAAAEGFSTFADAVMKLRFEDVAKMAMLSGILAPLGIALLTFSIGAAAGGAAMMVLGVGITAVAGGMALLAMINLNPLISQVSQMAVAVKELADATNSISLIKLATLGAISFGSTVLGAVAGTTEAGKQRDEGATIKDLLDAINSLRSDLKSGGIVSNVYLDSQLLLAGMARTNSIRGYVGGGTRLAT